MRLNMLVEGLLCLLLAGPLLLSALAVTYLLSSLVWASWVALWNAVTTLFRRSSEE